MPKVKDYVCRSYSAKGDITRRWYVAVTIYTDGQSKMHQYYGGINRIKSHGKRLEALRDLRKSIEKDLANGWRPETVQSRPRSSMLVIVGETLPKMLGGIQGTTKLYYLSALQRLQKWIEETGFEGSIDDFSESHALAFWRSLIQDDQICNNTKLSYWRAIRSSFTRMDKNPFTVKRPKLKARPRHNAAFDPGHLKRIYAEMNRLNPHMALFADCMYYLGTRRKDLTLVRIHDIDLERKLIRFKASNNKGGNVIFKRIPNHLACRLAPIVNSCPKIWYLFGKDPQSGELGPGPDHIQGSTLTKKFRRMIIRLGLDGHGYSLYSIRHTISTALMKNGASLDQVRRHLGHSSSRVTENYLRSLGSEALDQQFADSIPSPTTLPPSA